MPRGRLLVANADPGVGVKTTPATAKHIAGVGVYDLRTGRRVRYVDLAKVAGDGGEHFGNDMAVAPDGTFYATDSFGRSAEVSRAVSPWSDPGPTAVTVTPGGRAYVLSGRLDILFGGSASDAFTLRRF
ncbi:hypothetical protein AB0J52_03335 [Spirillospora sp. NPDC049652]